MSNNAEQPQISAAKIAAIASIISASIGAIASISVATISARGAVRKEAPGAVDEVLERVQWPFVQSSAKPIRFDPSVGGEWSRNNAAGGYNYWYSVNFKKPFSQVPQVLISLAENPRHKDENPIDGAKHLKWSISAIKIKEDSFTLQVFLADPALAWDTMALNWIAHLPPTIRPNE